jgi:hypothetical protein
MTEEQRPIVDIRIVPIPKEEADKARLDWDPYYKSVYGRDFPDDVPSAYIQWKGTNVCMDVYCSCGFHGHIDDSFAYYYQCIKCGKKYAVGSRIKLIELTPEEIAYHERDPHAISYKRSEDYDGGGE